MNENSRKLKYVENCCNTVQCRCFTKKYRGWVIVSHLLTFTVAYLTQKHPDSSQLYDDTMHVYFTRDVCTVYILHTASAYVIPTYISCSCRAHGWFQNDSMFKSGVGYIFGVFQPYYPHDVKLSQSKYYNFFSAL